MVVMDRRCLVDEFSLFFKRLTYIYINVRHCMCRFHQLV